MGPACAGTTAEDVVAHSLITSSRASGRRVRGSLSPRGRPGQAKRDPGSHNHRAKFLTGWSSPPCVTRNSVAMGPRLRRGRHLWRGDDIGGWRNQRGRPRAITPRLGGLAEHPHRAASRRWCRRDLDVISQGSDRCRRPCLHEGVGTVIAPAPSPRHSRGARAGRCCSSTPQLIRASRTRSGRTSAVMISSARPWCRAR